MPRSKSLVLWFPLCNNLCFLGPPQLQRQLSRRPERQKVLRKHTWKARRDAQTWRSRNKVTQAPFQIAPPYFLLSLLIDYIRDEYVHTSVYLVNPMSPLVNALTSFDTDISVRQRHDRRLSDLIDETRICQNCLEFGSFSNLLVIPPQTCAPGLFAQNLTLSLPKCISKWPVI